MKPQVFSMGVEVSMRLSLLLCWYLLHYRVAKWSEIVNRSLLIRVPYLFIFFIQIPRYDLVILKIANFQQGPKAIQALSRTPTPAQLADCSWPVVGATVPNTNLVLLALYNCRTQGASPPLPFDNRMASTLVLTACRYWNRWLLITQRTSSSGPPDGELKTAVYEYLQILLLRITIWKNYLPTYFKSSPCVVCER